MTAFREIRVNFDTESRFWDKVEKSDGCWLWTAAKATNGYGLFGDGVRMVRSHRYAYTSFYGPIPDGLTIDHLCRVRDCVNPTHLEAVSQRENLLRGETLAAQNAAKTNCPAGHPLEGSNLLIEKRGRRACLLCRRRANS